MSLPASIRNSGNTPQYVEMQKRNCFGSNQIKIVNHTVAMAEELVSNNYKMSASQWLGPRYDVKTLAELAPQEIIDGPFAQIIRYKGRRKNTSGFGDL